MSWCKLEPLYTEEPDSYHLLSACLFIKDQYIKSTYGYVRDVNKKKQNLFIKRLEEHVKMYDNGIWNDNTRLRIYIDKNLEMNYTWKLILNKYRKHPFFQWIKYDIPSKKDPSNPNIHMGLIGTLIRFHPLFVKNDKIKMISIIDMDSMYTSKWIDEIEKFKKSNYDMHCFCSMFTIPYYASIIEGISNEEAKGYWIAAGLFSSKVKLPINRWNKMLEYMIEVENYEMCLEIKKVIDNYDDLVNELINFV